MNSHNLYVQCQNLPCVYYSPYIPYQCNHIVTQQPYYQTQHISYHSTQNQCSNFVNSKEKSLGNAKFYQEINFQNQNKDISNYEQSIGSNSQNLKFEYQMANHNFIDNNTQCSGIQYIDNINNQGQLNKIDQDQDQDQDQNKNTIITKNNKIAMFRYIKNCKFKSIQLIQTIRKKQVNCLNPNKRQYNYKQFNEISHSSSESNQNINNLEELNGNPYFNQQKKRSLKYDKKIEKLKNLSPLQIFKQLSDQKFDDLKEMPAAKQTITNFCEVTLQSSNQISFNTENKQKTPSPNIFCDNSLKLQIKNLYGQTYENEQELTKKVVEDLSKAYKNYQKLNQGSTQLLICDEILNKQDQMIELINKCVYLITTCQIHKDFNLYCQGQYQNSPYSLSQINHKKPHKENYNSLLTGLQSSLDQNKSVSNQSFQNHTNNFNEHDEEISLKKQTNTNNSLKCQYFLNLFPISRSFLKNFDFSNIRETLTKKQKNVEKKPNSSYVKNSQYHNLNKLFMYNILSMFRDDSLNNLNIPKFISEELTKIILQFKISSRKDYKNPLRGFFDYFSHGHYKVLFLKINNKNIQQIHENEQDIELHEKCFNINLKNIITEMELSYINIIKEINYNIFMVNIQQETLYDDGSKSKQNIRRKYALRVIDGIQKLERGILIKRF